MSLNSSLEVRNPTPIGWNLSWNWVISWGWSDDQFQAVFFVAFEAFWDSKKHQFHPRFQSWSMLIFTFLCPGVQKFLQAAASLTGLLCYQTIGGSHHSRWFSVSPEPRLLSLLPQVFHQAGHHLAHQRRSLERGCYKMLETYKQEYDYEWGGFL